MQTSKIRKPSQATSLDNPLKHKAHAVEVQSPGTQETELPIVRTTTARNRGRSEKEAARLPECFKVMGMTTIQWWPTVAEHSKSR